MIFISIFKGGTSIRFWEILQGGTVIRGWGGVMLLVTRSKLHAFAFTF